MSDESGPLKPAQLPVPAAPSAAAVMLSDIEDDHPEFLHAVLCQVGLPRSRPNGRSFERSSGKAQMRLTAGEIAKPGGGWEEVGLPYGTKPRLVMYHICSEVVRTKRADVDLGGSMRKFIERIGITHGGPEL